MVKTIITTDSCMNPKCMDNMAPCIIIDKKEKTYCDMKTVNPEINAINNLEVFERSFGGERFKTAAPNIVDFINIMIPYLEQDCNIVHLSASPGISSGSLNGAKIARDDLNDEYGSGRVTVIDSNTAGSGGCVLNDYAVSLIEKGLTTREIVEELERVKHRIVSSYYISKVEGFASSGRAPKTIRISDRLSLRYRVDVNKNGHLMPAGVYRGGINKEFMKYLKTLINEENIESYNPNFIEILYTRLNEISKEEIVNYINSFKYFNKEIGILPFYGAISSYGVEDQIGIGLIKK